MQLFEYIDIMNTPYQIYMEDIRDPSFVVHSHWHYYVEILYVYEGHVLIQAGQKHCRASVGDLVVFPSGLLHQMRPIQTLPTRYAVLKFDLSTIKISRAYLPRIRQMLSQIGDSLPILLPKEEYPSDYFAGRITDALKELEERAFGYEANVLSDLSSLLMHLVRCYDQKETAPSPSESGKRGGSFFDSILEYMDAHADEPLQVQDLADKCGMSYSNFAKTFKEQHGRSCKEYLEYIRISKAEELVLYSNYDLSYIAQEVGFADTSHMIRTYKKFKHETPGQARRSFSAPAL